MTTNFFIHAYSFYNFCFFKSIFLINQVKISQDFISFTSLLISEQADREHARENQRASRSGARNCRRDQNERRARKESVGHGRGESNTE